MAAYLRIKPGTIILYGEHRHVFVASEQQRDRTRCGQVFEFVVEQVGDDTMEECRVGEHLNWTRTAKSNPETFDVHAKLVKVEHPSY
jgi:hypothetical protein